VVAYGIDLPSRSILDTTLKGFDLALNVLDLFPELLQVLFDIIQAVGSLSESFFCSMFKSFHFVVHCLDILNRVRCKGGWYKRSPRRSQRRSRENHSESFEGVLEAISPAPDVNAFSQRLGEHGGR
jgi:hypothetical protein